MIDEYDVIAERIWRSTSKITGNSATQDIAIILRESFPQSTEAKPVPIVQSAEDDACSIICGVSVAKGCKNKNLCSAALGASKRLESFAVAQRQAGREEACERAEKIAKGYVIMKARYAALEEAAKESERYMTEKGVSHEYPDMANLRKALSDLDSHKEATK